MSIRIGSDRAIVEIEPRSGGRLISMVIDGSEVLGAVPQSGPDWYRGIFPLAPWVGRLPQGRVRTGDLDFSVETDRTGDATHGVLYAVEWSVVTESAASVRLERRFGPGYPGGWPIGGSASQTFSIEQNAIRLSLEVRSDELPMPASIGFHPWFTRMIGGAEAEIGFSPSTRLAPQGDGFVATADLGRRPWDDLFTGLEANPTISWPGGPHLTLESSADVWVVYERMPDAFCIEPWSHPSGSFGAHSALLDPGDTLRLDLAIRFR